jgi:hypothetical protein
VVFPYGKFHYGSVSRVWPATEELYKELEDNMQWAALNLPTQLVNITRMNSYSSAW